MTESTICKPLCRPARHAATVATLFVLLFCQMFLPDAEAARFAYVGSDSCKECHQKIFGEWQKSIHGPPVFHLLASGVRPNKKKEAGLNAQIDYRNDKSCMVCHATGFGEGGYDIDNPESAWTGIGCETCHGAAERWLDLHKNKKLKKRKRKLKQAGMMQPLDGRSVCIRCHENAGSPYSSRDYTDRDWADLSFTGGYHSLGTY